MVVLCLSLYDLAINSELKIYLGHVIDLNICWRSFSHVTNLKISCVRFPTSQTNKVGLLSMNQQQEL